MKKLTNYLSAGLLIALSAATLTVNAANYSLTTAPYTNPLTGTSSFSALTPADDLFLDTISFNVGGPSILGFSLSEITLFPGYDIDKLKYSLFGPSGLVAGSFLGDGSSHSALLSTSGTYSFSVAGLSKGASGGAYTLALNVTAVPEPETYALMLAGLGLVGFAARRRKSAS